MTVTILVLSALLELALIWHWCRPVPRRRAAARATRCGVIRRLAAAVHPSLPLGPADPANGNLQPHPCRTRLELGFPPRKGRRTWWRQILRERVCAGRAGTRLEGARGWRGRVRVENAFLRVARLVRASGVNISRRSPTPSAAAD